MTGEQFELGGDWPTVEQSRSPLGVTSSGLASLNSARVELYENIHSGVVCPCCGQLAKVYRRRIYATPARQLIALFKLSIDNHRYHHITSFRHIQGGDLAKLRLWGLVEERLNVDTKKRCSGYWRITDKGRLYALNQLEVPRYCFLYNGKPLYFSEERAGIIEALGKRFDYEELMR